ncbi:MAG: helix-turn-helix domain-containing protein [Pseudomonadota bacterium]
MLEQWSTSAFAPKAQQDAWKEALSGSHMAWGLDHLPVKGFKASVTARGRDGFSVVTCRCDPCSGFRDRTHISAQDDALFGILLLHSGCEYVEQPGVSTALRSGEMMVWDASKPCRFEAPEQIEKTTIFLGREMLRRVSGQSELRLGRIDTQQGWGKLLLARLQSLGAALPGFDADGFDKLALSLADEVAQVARVTPRPLISPRSVLRARIERVMEAGYDDPDFGPPDIAAAVGISLRYLHALYSDTDTSVQSRLLQLRLTAVARDLRDPRLASASITQIGFARGFSNASHLSRTFRAAYGCTPRSYRHRGQV